MSKKMNAIAIIGFALLVVLGTANPARHRMPRRSIRRWPRSTNT